MEYAHICMYRYFVRYHCFAGREASRAMALLSFDESELANPRVDDLGAFGRGLMH